MTADVKTRIKAYYMLGIFTMIGFFGGQFYDHVIGFLFTLTMLAVILGGVEIGYYIEKRKEKRG